MARREKFTPEQQAALNRAWAQFEYARDTILAKASGHADERSTAVRKPATKREIKAISALLEA